MFSVVYAIIVLLFEMYVRNEDACVHDHILEISFRIAELCITMCEVRMIRTN